VSTPLFQLLIGVLFRALTTTALRSLDLLPTYALEIVNRGFEIWATRGGLIRPEYYCQLTDDGRTGRRLCRSARTIWRSLRHLVCLTVRPALFVVRTVTGRGFIRRYLGKFTHEQLLPLLLLGPQQAVRGFVVITRIQDGLLGQ
jgi:hypothetical protein